MLNIVTFVSHNGVNVMIGPKNSPFTRSMHIELTQYHHLDALLAMIVWYIGPTINGLYDYPQCSVT